MNDREEELYVKAMSRICMELSVEWSKFSSTWHVQAGENPGELMITSNGKNHWLTLPVDQWAALMKKLSE